MNASTHAGSRGNEGGGSLPLSGRRLLVLTIGPCAPGWRLFREAATLRDAGCHVTVIAWARGERGRRETWNEGLRIWWIGVPGRFNRGLRSLPALLGWGIRALLLAWGERFDFIHCQDIQTLPFGFLLSRLRPWHRGGRLVYASHELWSDPFPATTLGRRLYRLLARGLERLLVPRCDGVVTTTRGWARIIAARYGKEAIVVRNAPEVTGRIVPVSWRERLHLPPERKILLYAGGLQEGRGLFPIVEALPTLPHCDLLLLGRSIDRMRERLEERSASLGVRGRVHFLPPVPAVDLLAYLGDADLGLSLIEATSLSHRYCLPNKVFEYLVAGIPVLVSDLPEMRDFVTTFRVGWVAPSLEAAVLSATIEEIFTNGEAFRETAERIARLQPSFTWRGEGAKLIAGYRALTTTRKGGRP